MGSKYIWAVVVATALVFADAAEAGTRPRFNNPIMQDHLNQLTRYYSGQKKGVSKSMRAWIPRVTAVSKELVRLAGRPNAIQEIHDHAENVGGKTWTAMRDMFKVMGQDRVPMVAAGLNEGRSAALKRIQLAYQVLDNQKALDLFRMGLNRMQGNEKGYQQAVQDYRSVFRAQRVLLNAEQAYKKKASASPARSAGNAFGVWGAWMNLGLASMQAGVKTMNDMNRVWSAYLGSSTRSSKTPENPMKVWQAMVPAPAAQKPAAPKTKRPARQPRPNSPRSSTFGYLSVAAKDAADSADLAIRSGQMVRATTFGLNPWLNVGVASAKAGARGKVEMIHKAAAAKEGGGLMGYAVATMTGNPRWKRVFATDIVEGRRARRTCESALSSLATGSTSGGKTKPNMFDAMAGAQKAWVDAVWGPWLPGSK
jgi:hypothetical protein